MGAELLIETLAGLAAGRLSPRRQDDGHATFAPRVQKADAALDWELAAPALANRIRAFSPAPVAFTALAGDAEEGKGELLRIHRAAADIGTPPANGFTPGSFRIAGSRRAPRLAVTCGEGSTLWPLDVQAAGRRRMPIEDFLRGRVLAAPIGEQGTPVGRFLGAAQAARLAEAQ
ncbi:Methionyl-tRNA formyltransferase [Geodia barretti]|uniref:Methionyl-tRNA formyltransferase n=1 Tax=Geodia barretti TaxID=519541 RepID=A0AA35QVR7_GEOBA|nr:Methionyl-tRNA formyltransferase [Geodia barretti]